jgi:hypothetical protein
MKTMTQFHADEIAVRVKMRTIRPKSLQSPENGMAGNMNVLD